MKNTEQRVKELESLKERHYAIIDAIINIEGDNVLVTSNMRAVLQECNSRIFSYDELLSDYETA